MWGLGEKLLRGGGPHFINIRLRCLAARLKSCPSEPVLEFKFFTSSHALAKNRKFEFSGFAGGSCPVVTCGRAGFAVQLMLEGPMGRVFGLLAAVVALALGMYVYSRQAQSASAAAGANNPKAAIDITGVKADLISIATSERRYYATEGKYAS